MLCLLSLLLKVKKLRKKMDVNFIDKNTIFLVRILRIATFKSGRQSYISTY